MLEKTLKEFVYYASTHLDLNKNDLLYFENLLLHEFKLNHPYMEEIDKEKIASLTIPDSLIGSFISDLIKEGYDETSAEREADYILGLLSPIPSKVNEVFDDIEKKEGAKKATSYLYNLGIYNHYFQKTRVEKNLIWNASYKDGSDLIITINLSKPEKNNKDVAKLLSSTSVDYPKCPLCEENIGYYGDNKHAARTNLRFINLSLAGEEWFLQYSPYGYYHEHCIAFSKKHTPMCISRKTFIRLFDFVDRFPFYFIGSNSDLPIVGGSILNHEHFQGGLPILPIFKAGKKEIVYKSNKGSEVSILSFYVSSICLEGKDRHDIEDIASLILEKWRPYTDECCAIISGTGENLHNTITPYAFKKEDGTYRLILALRNNRTSEEYPEGIFHAHPEYLPIKKEGIGLIESAGLFVLPARLKRQMSEIEDVVNNNLTNEQALEKYSDISPFFPMIEIMKKDKISAKEYVNRVCQGILRNVAVFKDDEIGQKGFHKFLKEVFNV